MEKKAIRVLVVDDHPVVIGGIRALLAEDQDIEIVGEAYNGAMAIDEYRKLEPDLILMDLILPEMDGIKAIRLITEEYPEARILVMTSFITDDKVIPAIKAGAMGYMLKDSEPEDLIKAIHDVYRGKASLHPNIARKVLDELCGPTQEKTVQQLLTERETQVLQLLAKGCNNKEIAEKLFIGETTVRTFVSRILKKLHLDNRVQATLYALREGLTSLEED